MSDPDYSLGPAAESQRPALDRWRFLRTSGNVCAVLFILLILAGIALGPIGPGVRYRPESAAVQQARQIGLMMFSYANDNDGNYPDGKSSTEVFQKLIDGQYCSDPTIFYVSLPGKTKAIAGQKLKPENVCFDVTSGADSHAPDGLPLVFMTGYKVNYVSGGMAVPLVKPYPPFWTRTWLGWWQGEPEPLPRFRDEPLGHGIAVCYKGINATFMQLDTTAKPNGSISNFVPPTFDAKGKTYRQLTPDGPLPQ